MLSEQTGSCLFSTYAGSLRVNSANEVVLAYVGDVSIHLSPEAARAFGLALVTEAASLEARIAAAPPAAPAEPAGDEQVRDTDPAEVLA